MAKFEKIEDIIVWQKSQDFVIAIYQCFKVCRDFSFRDQFQRASVSIMNNIAEGFERSGNKEFKKFLYIAKGSCGEVRSMLYLAVRLKYIDQKQFDQFYADILAITKMIGSLIKVLNT